MDDEARFYKHTDSSKSKISAAFSDVSDDAKLTAWHQVPRMPTYNDVYNLSPQDPGIIRDRSPGGWPRPVIPITPAQKKGKIRIGHLDSLKNEYSAKTLSGMKTGGGSILEFIRKQKESVKALDREQQMRDTHRNKEMEWEEAISKSNEMLKGAKIDGLRMSRELMNDVEASEGVNEEVSSEYQRKKPLAITWDGAAETLGNPQSTAGMGSQSASASAGTSYNAAATFTSTKGSTRGMEQGFDFKVPATEHLHMRSTHFPRAHEERFAKMHTNILFKTPDDNTRLFEAAIYDDYHVVRGLLELLPEAANITDSNGNSVLSIAALYGSAVTAELLIYAGAQLDHKNNFGLSPFDLACVRKNKKVAALLLFSGATASFEHCTPKCRVAIFAERQELEMGRRRQALFEALDRGEVLEVARLIAEEGVDVNSVDPRASPDDPYSPLHVALLASPEPNVQLVKLLLEKGADIGIMDINGDTPLHIACAKGSEESSPALIECVAALLEKEQMSMDQMPPNMRGRTALFHACMTGNLTIALMLFEKLPILANRHELERRDDFGHACLYYANAAKASDLCAYLVEQGVSVSLPVTAV